MFSHESLTQQAEVSLTQRMKLLAAFQEVKKCCAFYLKSDLSSPLLIPCTTADCFHHNFNIACRFWNRWKGGKGYQE